jgi:hypothetical protein
MGEKLHHVITVNVINIATHIEATQITSKVESPQSPLIRYLPADIAAAY